MNSQWKEPRTILTIVLVILAVASLYYVALPSFPKNIPGSITLQASSTGPITTLTTGNFQNLSIGILKPDPNNMSAWLPIVVNGQFERYAIIEKGKQTWFEFNMTNTGGSVLHLLGVSYQFTYPNGEMSGQFTGSIVFELYPKQSTYAYLTYGTNLPSFSGGFGKLVFVVYGENNEWTKSITIPLAF